MILVVNENQKYWINRIIKSDLSEEQLDYFKEITQSEHVLKKTNSDASIEWVFANSIQEARVVSEEKFSDGQKSEERNAQTGS